jgi:hypothetical protein
MLQIRFGWLVVSSMSLHELKAGDVFTLSAGRTRRVDRLSRVLSYFGVSRYTDEEPLVVEVAMPALPSPVNRQ